MGTNDELLRHIALPCAHPPLPHTTLSLPRAGAFLERLFLTAPLTDGSWVAVKVPTYGNCSNGHAGMESEVLRVRYTSATKRNVST